MAYWTGGSGKEAGFAGFHNQSEKSNVCRVEIGSLDPAHEKQIATCWHLVYITAPYGMASASSATSLVATDTSRDD
jgi:hypothetical protein